MMTDARTPEWKETAGNIPISRSDVKGAGTLTVRAEPCHCGEHECFGPDRLLAGYQCKANTKALDFIAEQAQQIATLSDDLARARQHWKLAEENQIRWMRLHSALEAQVADQRAELTGTLSERFRSLPACYDTPADHYREMARRIVEDRDELKHQNRALTQQRRACACSQPDPVMQADSKFYCYMCSFETGARPKDLLPEETLAELRARAEAAERELARLRQHLCEAHIHAVTTDGHYGYEESWPERSADGIGGCGLCIAERREYVEAALILKPPEETP